MLYSVVSVDLKGLKQYNDRIHDQLQTGVDGPVSKCLRLWAVRYRSFAQLRFDQYSRGGGDWAPLAASTMKRRRQGKGPKKFGILRDTGTLFAALAPTFIGSPGAIEALIPFGILCGYGGNQRYVDGHGKISHATIADIASFHNDGFIPRLPKRQIIVEPPMYLLDTMAKDMDKALEAQANA